MARRRWLVVAIVSSSVAFFSSLRQRHWSVAPVRYAPARGGWNDTAATSRYHRACRVGSGECDRSPRSPRGDRRREGNRPGPCRATRIPARADAVVRRARARVDVRHGREGADVSVGVRPRAVPRCLPATEHAVLTLDRGRVSWWRDDLTLAPCTKPGVCPGAPVEIVANTEVSSTRSEVRANTAVNPTRRNRPV